MIKNRKLGIEVQVMFMENIKRNIISLLLTSALILSCGCQSTENNSQISDSRISSTPQENVTDNNDIITAVTEAETSAAPAETTEMELGFVPNEWILIGDSYEVLLSFISVMNADCSEGEISDIIYSLVRKNVLFSLTKWGYTFEIDWDNPITYGEDELTLYPAVSVFFHDVKSIYELASSVYGINDEIYTYDPSSNNFYSGDRLFFTEINGKMYVNTNSITNIWAPEPFSHYSYIEITEQTEDMCKLTWHYPDVEGLNEPDKYIDYYYYEGYYTARYIDGAWRLDRMISYLS